MSKSIFDSPSPSEHTILSNKTENRPIVIQENNFLDDIHRLTKLKQRLEAEYNSIKIVREKINTNNAPEQPVAFSGEKLLLQLAKLNERHLAFPIDAVADGTFAGSGTLQIEDGKVILYRHAKNTDHLIKDGKPATLEEMRTASEFSGSVPTAGALHTSANEHWSVAGADIVGTFKIPVADFLHLAKEGKILIGNLGECEIIISGDVGTRYLTEVKNKNTGETFTI